MASGKRVINKLRGQLNLIPFPVLSCITSLSNASVNHCCISRLGPCFRSQNLPCSWQALFDVTFEMTFQWRIELEPEKSPKEPRAAETSAQKIFSRAFQESIFGSQRSVEVVLAKSGFFASMLGWKQHRRYLSSPAHMSRNREPPQLIKQAFYFRL